MDALAAVNHAKNVQLAGTLPGSNTKSALQHSSSSYGDLAELILNASSSLAENARTISLAINALSPDPEFAGTLPRALAVGGYVRDLLLGKESKDIDIEVYGVSAERLEKLLEDLYPGRINTVGRSFGILKVSLGNGLDIDVSIPRTESKTGIGHKGFAVEGNPALSIQEAARRRDFTWNALAADLVSGEIIDAFFGIEHLKAGLMVVTDAERFQDDPLRVYRAVQFASRLGFKIEARSMELMKDMVSKGVLEELPRERITEELVKLLLKSEKPSLAFELMRELGIIERYFPELHALTLTPQDPEWHPEGDVWVHTMRVLDSTSHIVNSSSANFSSNEKIQALLGALCHDLGKPLTTVVDPQEGRIRSPNHEAAGEEPARRLLGRFSFSTEIEDAVLKITTLHMRPGVLYRALESKKMDDYAYINDARKLLREIHPTSIFVFLAACEGDFRGRALETAKSPRCNETEFLKETILKNDLNHKALLFGRDLIALGLEPGEEFGKIIHEVEKRRDDRLIKTRGEAIQFVKLRYLLQGRDLIDLGFSPGPTLKPIFDRLKVEISAGSIQTRAEAFRFVQEYFSSDAA